MIILIIIEVLIFYLFSSNGTNSDILSFVFIFANSLYFYLQSANKKTITYILLGGYIFRIIILFLDYYRIVPILHSGVDTENFHNIALNIMHSKSLDVFTLTNYDKFLGLTYCIIGPQRLYLQYINVLMGMGIIIYLYRLTEYIGISDRNRIKILFLATFLPHSMIFSSILLRECWVSFFLICSIYHFFKWYYNKLSINFILSFVFVFISSMMHSGVLFIIIGYLWAILFSNKQNKISFMHRFFLGCFSFLIIYFTITQTDIFTEKFDNNLTNKTKEESLALINNAAGGSVYLSSLTLDNPFKAFLYSPLKMFYFQFSPLPLDWRGFSDIVAFFLDSIIYMYIYILIYKSIKLNKDKDSFFKIVLICYMSVLFIFSYGTSNSGTALRHRNKVYPELLLLLTMSMRNRSNDEKTILGR